ncbi:putative nuclease HARBI1 [Merluccius polli]|uniref:Nuclease HARBI1 n=1 Tax=Merluccius polli TaxID=89951 RepID=A0AA47MA53_MERPO|nr:putative nuclease HARBI1 [Merluccius polli]
MIKANFMAIAGMAGVVGAVDGTHIQIIAPSKDEDVFVNRKKVHSINTQIAFDATFNILDVAKWPAGSTRDPRILMESGLRREVGYQLGVLLGDGDETNYRKEVLDLTAWCSSNNLELNITKTKEIIIDFRKKKTDLTPLYINGACVEKVRTFKYLGTVISEDLSWSSYTTAVVKKAQQRIHFLRVLRRNNLESKLLETFYRSCIGSLLTHCISVWYASCTVADKKRLQRVVKTTQRIIGHPLPSLDSIYTSRCSNKARNILWDSLHPGHHLFNLLPSGRRYRRHLRNKRN